MISGVLALETAKAVAMMVTELLKFYQTPQGEKVVNQMIADRAAWDAGWKTFQSNFFGIFKRDEIGQ